MNSKLNLLIVDDSLIFTQGLSLLLKQYPETIDQIHIAHNYDNALNILKSNKIDVCVLDLNFESREYTGFTIAKKIKEIYPLVKIIILTQQAKVDYHQILFEDINVDGYLDKQLGIEETLESLQTVMRGEKYIDKNIQNMLDIGKWLDISDREKEIIHLLSAGLTQKEIAGKLFISNRTVETHIKNLTTKIGAKNSVHLVSIYTEYKKGNRENIS